MERYDIEKLRSLPIESIASRLGLTVKKHKSLCPFHQDTRPSLTFNTRKNTYKCYVCNAHGGPIDLVMGFLKKSFVEACQWLANENNIILTEYKPIPKPYTLNSTPSVDVRHLSMLVAQPYLCPEAKKFLFEERHIKPEVVEKLGLSSISSPVPMSGDLNGSWFNAPSLLIPYKDIDGNLISVQSRYLGNDKTKPRFQFPKGSKCTIFNLNLLKQLKPSEPLFITEGVSDCLAMLSAGFKAIAIPSATLLRKEDIEHLNLEHLNLHMYPDQDAPGERLYLDLVAMCKSVTRHQLPEGFKDVGQYYSFIHKDDNL